MLSMYRTQDLVHTNNYVLYHRVIPSYRLYYYLVIRVIRVAIDTGSFHGFPSTLTDRATHVYIILPSFNAWQK